MARPMEASRHDGWGLGAFLTTLNGRATVAVLIIDVVTPDGADIATLTLTVYRPATAYR